MTHELIVELQNIKENINELTSNLHNNISTEIKALLDLIQKSQSIKIDKQSLQTFQRFIAMDIKDPLFIELATTCSVILQNNNDLKEHEIQNLITDIFQEIFLFHMRIREFEYVKTRRKNLPIVNHNNDELFGLALSGGGIRSASFNLGILQAMEKCNVLKNVDYLSTVSGGGYIGSSLSWFMTKNAQNKEYPFPFGTSRKDTSKEPGKIVSWIRDHGNYLISGEGINIWTAVAAFISAMFVNVLLFFTFFFSIFLLLNLPISTWAGKLISFVTIIMILFILYKKSLKLKSPKLKKYLFLILAFSALVLPYYLFIYDFTDPSDKNTFSSLLVLGLVSFICLGLFALHYSKEKVSPSLEHDVKVVYGHFFMYGTLFICIGLIPVIHCYLENISFMNMETSLLLTGASGLFMILSTIKGAAKNRLNEIVIFIGLTVLLIGVVVSIF
ncbi:MAG TPA: hypothetical protein ENK91_07490, partial [Bacteroidetes bacterium]|nr:hypothetical protein [Bacteroidota bacterium]